MRLQRGNVTGRVAAVLDLMGYLARLGLDHPGEPTLDALFALHRAQVERVAYTTVDIQRGRPPSIDSYESAARVAAIGRGGYCYHLNGALSVVLAALGYDVHRHRGSVWRDPAAPLFQPYANHLALTVRGLPSPENPVGVWFVDAGLGDALHEPIALRAGPVTQGIFTYRLSPSPLVPGGWRFEHDPRCSFNGMDFEPGDATMADFADGHADLSTSRTSSFVRRLTAQRRHADGCDKLVSCTVLRTRADGVHIQRLASSAEVRSLLADEFGLPLDDLEPGEWDAVYQKARAAQEEYDRTVAHA